MIGVRCFSKWKKKFGRKKEFFGGKKFEKKKLWDFFLSKKNFGRKKKILVEKKNLLKKNFVEKKILLKKKF